MRVYTNRNKSNFVAKTVSIPRTPLIDTTARYNYREQAHTLADAARSHSWTFATLDAISRSAIGAGWKFVPVERYKSEATDANRKRMEAFFEFNKRKWDNIKDYQSLPDKFYITFNSYRLLGQAAWEIVRDGNGTPIGFDTLPGVTLPNVDAQGYFKPGEAEFLHYPWGQESSIEYTADELAFFFNSGVTGRVTGESTYMSLLSTALPADLFAAISYRSLFQNVNSPYNGIWSVDQSVTDEDYEMFVGLLEDRYTGPENFGANPLVIRGSAEFNAIRSRNQEDAPYLEGRIHNRQEFIGVTGVDGNKLGMTESSNKANMRETRREFSENTLRPVFRKLENDIYHQICVRVLGIRGWKLVFNQPDVTTPIEQASIDMRYLQWGVKSPNQILIEHGLDPRPGGDYFFVPLNMAVIDADGNMISDGGQNDQGDGGNQRGDRNTQPDDNQKPSGEEPSTPTTEPARSTTDERPQSSNESSKIGRINELKTWRRNHLKYLDGKRANANFTPKEISNQTHEVIKQLLEEAGTDFAMVKSIFEAIITIEESYG